MAYWKVRVYKLEKTACNVCLDILAEWRVKPNDVALSVPVWLLCYMCMYSNLCLKLLCLCCIVEYLFVWWRCWNAFVDICFVNLLPLLFFGIIVAKLYGTIYNLYEVSLLDLTFDLTTGKYKPYKQLNDDPLYIASYTNTLTIHLAF